jgi:GT2 family glycosyltransferase
MRVKSKSIQDGVDSLSIPRVTIVVVPRERLSFIQRSLSTTFEQTSIPFNLIYVSGGLPVSVRQSLEEEARQKNFKFIHSENYLSPNQARNLALPHITTPYVVFLDNDALVTRGWLEALLKCADETGASIVGPLYLIGEFDRAIVHMAGGRLHLKEEAGNRILWDEQYLFDTSLSETTARLRRRSCDYMEFHCMLVRTNLFERIGRMDEQLRSLHEERDICLAALKEGGSVFIEPRSVVTYVPPPPFEWWDIPYFMLRWSDLWTVESVRRFNTKWNIKEVRHISDTKNAYEEGSVVGFARAWRRRIAGVNILSGSSEVPADLPVDQARLMVALMQSFDREYFDLALAAGNGHFVEVSRSLSSGALLREIPRVMEKAETEGLNLLIRPLRRDPIAPTVLRFDDCTRADLKRWESQAFLTLQTGPERYQCWLAFDTNDVRLMAHLPEHASNPVASAESEGFVPLAGMRFVPFHANPAGSFHVRIIKGIAGHLTLAHQLEGKAPFLATGVVQ